MSEQIFTCPECHGKYNGLGRTHSHTSPNGPRDDRFLTCFVCKGHGAVTCETCQGNGRVKMEGGKIVGYYSRQRTAPLQHHVDVHKAKKGD